METAPIPPNNQQQQFAFRPPSRPRQVTPVSMRPNNIAMYQSSSMSYPHMSMWERTGGNPSAAPSPYLVRPAFHHGTPSPAAETAEGYGLSEMEVPYTEGFAWPFQLAETADGQHISGQGSQPHQGPHHPLTPQDIAAFMRINPGDEPFL